MHQKTLYSKITYTPLPCVDDLTTFSDHRPLTIRLKCKTNVKRKISEHSQTKIKFSKRPTKFKIDNKIKYKDDLSHVMNKNYVNILITKLDNCNDIHELNNITSSVATIYKDAGNKITITNKNKIQPKNKNKDKNKNEWYNYECTKLKRQLNQITKSLNRNPHKQEIRVLFFKTKAAYRKLLKNAKRKHEENIMSKMEQLYNKDKNEFWKFLKSLKNNTSNTELPELNDLISHFHSLYIKENTPDKINIEQNDTSISTDTNIFNTLNDNVR